MTIHCIHHNDLDGWAAAYLVEQAVAAPVEFHEIDYNQPTPDVGINNIVFIVDFSFSKEILTEMSKHNRVVVIDHHDSALRRLEGITRIISHKELDSDESLFISYDLSVCGAMGVWNFFDLGTVPEWLKIVNAGDVWDWSYPNSKVLIHAFYTKKLSMELISYIANLDASELLIQAQTAFEYKNTTIELLSKNAYVMEIDEFRAVAINQSVYPSDLCRFILDNSSEEIDIGICYTIIMREVPEVKFNLRSRNGFLVNILAERFGGGGHPAAAGFSIPFSHFNPLKVASKP
jgi:oligoribonuclease NrnB/cAMP/cGMP phosphodiesterase (DHH superfamily)